MEKSILVIDTPSCCGGCPCCKKQEDNWGDIAWAECYNGKSVYDYYDVGRPDWCPLKPLPQRKMPKFGEAYPQSMVLIDRWKGYDECLDDILGDTE